MPRDALRKEPFKLNRIEQLVGPMKNEKHLLLCAIIASLIVYICLRWFTL
jgi:hypothetical protein